MYKFSMNYICEFCNGEGTFGPFLSYSEILKKYRGQVWSDFIRKWKQDRVSRLFQERCSKCLGDGRLDWVERVVGKRLENARDKKM